MDAYVVIPIFVSHAHPQAEVRINKVLAQDEPDHDRSRRIRPAPKCTAGKRSGSGSVNQAEISGRLFRALPAGQIRSGSKGLAVPRKHAVRNARIMALTPFLASSREEAPSVSDLTMQKRNTAYVTVPDSIFVR